MLIFEIPELLPPSEDGVFKALLTMPGAELVLRDVVASAIALPVLTATVRNVEMPITNINEKRERFDVNCTLDDDVQADVEMQSEAMEGDSKANNHKVIKSRAVYNLCDLHSAQDGRSIRYDKLSRSFQVMFCGYTVFPNHEGFVHRFSFRDENGVQLSDAVGIVFIELTKLNDVLKKPVEDMTALEMWSIFFAHADKPKYRDVLTRMTAAKEEIKVATELLSTISKDEIERAHFRSRRMYRMDIEHNLAVARDEGRNEGRDEGESTGERNKANSIAKNLIDLAIPLEQIVQATGLPREEVERLCDGK
jgi:predicted transposase/invertase (TIGR01784 family)